jgi:EF-hand domain pair
MEKFLAKSVKKMSRFAIKKKSQSAKEVSVSSDPNASLGDKTPLARNNAADTSKSDPLLVEKEDSDDDGTMVIDHSPVKVSIQKKTSIGDNLDRIAMSTAKLFSVSETAARTPASQVKTTTFRDDDTYDSANEDKLPKTPFFPFENDGVLSSTTDDSGFTLLRTGSTTLPNPDALVTSHLVQWKFAAEEGPVILRILAVLGAVAVMVTSILPLYIYEEDLRDLNFLIPYLITTLYIFMATLMICILDGRSFCVRNPLSCRAKLRNIVTRNFNILTLVWGRGLLYVFVGGLQITQMWDISLYAGGSMALIGIIALIFGFNASGNLATLRSSLTDDDFLWSEFNKYDRDKDGMLDPSDFAKFIYSLGLEFDDLNTLKAFNTVDTDRDRKISYVQFREWWSQCAEFEDDASSGRRSVA